MKFRDVLAGFLVLLLGSSYAYAQDDFYPVIKDFVPSKPKSAAAKVRKSSYHPVSKPFVAMHHPSAKIRVAHKASATHKKTVVATHQVKAAKKIADVNKFKAGKLNTLAANTAHAAPQQPLQAAVPSPVAAPKMEFALDKKHQDLAKLSVAAASMPQQKQDAPAAARVTTAMSAQAKAEQQSDGKIKDVKPQAVKVAAAKTAPTAKATSPFDGSEMQPAKSAQLNFARTSMSHTIKMMTVKLAVKQNKIDLPIAEKPQPVAAAKPSVKSGLQVNPVVAARTDEKIQAVSQKVEPTTTANVAANPSTINPIAAIHSLFVSQSPKKPTAPGISGLPPVAVKLQQPAPIIAAPNTPKLPAAAPDTKDKMVVDSDADKHPVIKVVTADLSKNEFYILGENDPIPAQLAENPDTQMAILGGDMDVAARKVMEFKMAALQAAKARAAKLLAEKEANAKALAELELEEKEANAKLAAAQKAVNDLQKLKEYQQSREEKIGDIADKTGAKYKDSFVKAVVPEKIIEAEGAKAQKKELVSVKDVAISTDEIAQDDDVLEADNSSTTAKQQMAANAVSMAHTKLSPQKEGFVNIKQQGKTEQLSERQINDAVIKINSSKHKRASQQAAKTASKPVAARKVHKAGIAQSKHVKTGHSKHVAAKSAAHGKATPVATKNIQGKSASTTNKAIVQAVNTKPVQQGSAAGNEVKDSQ